MTKDLAKMNSDVSVGPFQRNSKIASWLIRHYICRLHSEEFLKLCWFWCLFIDAESIIWNFFLQNDYLEMKTILVQKSDNWVVTV